MMKRYSVCSILFFVVLLSHFLYVGDVQADATTFTSDDFNYFNLNTSLWTYTDPAGDDTLYMAGTNTSDAQLHISNPAGSAHDFWESTPRNAPRIMQSANNDNNFQIEVKFQSEMFNKIAIEGVLVEQDADDVLRFDFDVRQDSIRVFAANFNSGNAITEIDSGITLRQTGPIDLYMRVKRQTSTWTMYYSFDGSTWNLVKSFTRTMTVTKVGLFFGNVGAPLNKGVVDYFFNTDSPIASEDGATVTDITGPMIYNVNIVPGDTYFDIYWMTDEPAKGSVDYGLTDSYGSTVDSSSAGFKIGHHVRITGLNKNTTYHFRINSEDNVTPTPNSSSTGDYQDTSLPVELIAFTADASDGEVLLSWQTASEVNNIGFEVYRSDGNDSLYQMIASYRTDPDLLGAGNSTRLHNYNYRDQGLNNGISYWYKIADVDLAGKRTFHGPVTAIPDRSRSLIAQQFQLLPNYPNPFNPTTTLKFKVDSYDNSESVVKLVIYNGNGQIVRELFNNSVSDGNYVVRWDGRDRNGRIMPSGYYFARLESGKFSQTRKMLLLK